MAIAANLGFPRIGPHRELKKGVEGHWSGEVDPETLHANARDIRRRNWTLQKEAGLDHIPSNDFSLYDHVLDTAAMLGAVPSRYRWTGDSVGLHTYFAMARGVQEKGLDVPAMEMTKWFDTNYHYIVPEFERGMNFRLATLKPVEEFEEARDLGIHTRPVLLGPVSFLLLGKSRDAGLKPLDLLDDILPVYEDVLRRLARAGADWVQVDEPCLVLDLDDAARAAYARAYDRLAAAADLKLLLATYFEGMDDANMDTAFGLPVAGVHIDLVRAPGRLAAALDRVRDGVTLSLGVVDGRNVWRTDLERALDLLEQAASRIGAGRVMAAPSCSLLHVPYDLMLETRLDDELRSWMAFARQKLDELEVLARGVAEGREAVRDALAESARVIESRRASTRIHDEQVTKRLAAVTPGMMRRQSPFAERRRKQGESIRLPALPTTTIGSFPQTREVRRARAQFRRGERDEADYVAFVKSQIAEAIRMQEEVGLDVLVHGEFERNDMVEYFGEQLRGFAFTSNGWVQSYGTRCVKPPVIYGDVSRPGPMTVEWTRYAQSLTDRAVKGMLTGPITILQWSFVRDDQPREVTAKQIALAIRDEVKDLEDAGIRIIQIDEPAFREGLPLHRADWPAYLRGAVEAFRLASCGVRDETQIHTHMCYSEFNDIIEAIAALDADVISIETSRSQMELLDAFIDFRYPNEIGPGVYDIHSPRVPATDEMAALIRRAGERLSLDQIWVNPDCGLKTRGWDEIRAALAHMVAAAQSVRERLAAR